MRPTTFEVGPGAIVKVGESVFCVKRWESSDSVLVRDVVTSADRILKLAEITESLAREQAAYWISYRDRLASDGFRGKASRFSRSELLPVQTARQSRECSCPFLQA